MRSRIHANGRQKWDRLRESHAKDIVVTWPDGHETKGIDKHIDDLKALFVFAPDIQIKTHPMHGVLTMESYVFGERIYFALEQPLS